jgi:hypothetical protein
VREVVVGVGGKGQIQNLLAKGRGKLVVRFSAGIAMAYACRAMPADLCLEALELSEG